MKSLEWNQMPSKKNLADEIAKLLGISTEEVVKEVGDPTRQLESTEELLLEAQSVVNYFEYRGAEFYREVCKECNQKFRYTYYYKGIKLCSVKCMALYLESLGLKWTPHKPLDERWGFRGAPMVVAPQALRLVDSLLLVGIQDPLPFDSLDETSLQSVKEDNLEEHHPEELDQFLESLDQTLEKLGVLDK